MKNENRKAKKQGDELFNPTNKEVEFLLEELEKRIFGEKQEQEEQSN